jgi:hypothetical protein
MEREIRKRRKVLNVIKSHIVTRTLISIEAANGHGIKKIILNGDGTLFGFICNCTEHRKTVHCWDKKKRKIIY